MKNELNRYLLSIKKFSNRLIKVPGIAEGDSSTREEVNHQDEIERHWDERSTFTLSA